MTDITMEIVNKVSYIPIANIIVRIVIMASSKSCYIFREKAGTE